MRRTCSFGIPAVIFTVLAFSLGLSSIAGADMGRVYASLDPVTVSEDSQKAIILHNLDEEVLILGTDLKASKKTGIIRFIRRARRRVAPAGAFDRAAAMIKKYGLKYQSLFSTKGGPANQAEGVDFANRSSAHDMTVIRVNDVRSSERVNKYFKGKGLTKKKYPEEEGRRGHYEAGIVYFVLDYVEITVAALHRAGRVPVQERFQIIRSRPRTPSAARAASSLSSSRPSPCAPETSPSIRPVARFRRRGPRRGPTGQSAPLCLASR